MQKSEMLFYAVIVLTMIFQNGFLLSAVIAQSPRVQEPLIIRKCEDFNVTGKGDNPEWNKIPWALLTKLDEGCEQYESKFKVLYSSSGIYVLFHSKDDKITTKDYKDFENIFNDDVVEVFFHPDPQVASYFEYEVNALNIELILTISNLNGQGLKSWVPWHPRGKNGAGIIKMVDVVGEQKVNGKIQSWSAEIFFPYAALGLLPNVPPKSGTIWNANFCRLDYDTGKMIKWSWTPTIEKSFHELEKFRSVRFE